MKLKITIEGNYVYKMLIAQLIQEKLVKASTLSEAIIVDEYAGESIKTFSIADMFSCSVILIKKPEVIKPMSQEDVDQYFEDQVYIEKHSNKQFLKMNREEKNPLIQINETKLLNQLIAADESRVRMTTTVINDQQEQLKEYKARLEALKLKRGH